ncbi:MAG: hypothetical protein GF317_14495 [Candidatus Lokiarchaeota archaeon]|nr:hypothetical protein [Candidatus Lokiarchaeota archaeon]MBD3200816.1 hypothetical protein [Candidatus Lokiarchaeota archaeon]
MKVSRKSVAFQEIEKNHENEVKNLPSPECIQNKDIIYLKLNHKNFGSEHIYDETGNVLLKIGRHSTFNNGYYTLEINERTKYILTKKPFSLHKTYYFISPMGESIKFQKVIFSSPPCFYSKTLEGKELLKADFEITRNNYCTIINPSKNKPVCELNSVNPAFLNDSECNECLKLVVKKKEINRILLLGFIIYIRNFFRNSNGISDIAGFGRQLARLRPFGPKSFEEIR